MVGRGTGSGRHEEARMLRNIIAAAAMKNRWSKPAGCSEEVQDADVSCDGRLDIAERT